jgi:hypothetical protein
MAAPPAQAAPSAADIACFGRRPFWPLPAPPASGVSRSGRSSHRPSSPLPAPLAPAAAQSAPRRRPEPACAAPELAAPALEELASGLPAWPAWPELAAVSGLAGDGILVNAKIGKKKEMINKRKKLRGIEKNKNWTSGMKK